MTKKSKAASRDRISRLFLWLDQNLDDLEQNRKATSEGCSVADREKEARTMISLIRVYEKLVEMKEHLEDNRQGDSKTGAGAGAGAGKSYDHDEAEQKRREIARRIERLQQSPKNGQGFSG